MTYIIFFLYYSHNITSFKLIANTNNINKGYCSRIYKKYEKIFFIIMRFKTINECYKKKFLIIKFNIFNF